MDLLLSLISCEEVVRIYRDAVKVRHVGKSVTREDKLSVLRYRKTGCFSCNDIGDILGVFGASVSFAGTSLIIIVSVILETMKQIESQMLVRNYKGFLND